MVTMSKTEANKIFKSALAEVTKVMPKGFTVLRTGGSYNDTEFSFRFEFGRPNDEGKTKAETDYNLYAVLSGLPKSALGTVVTINRMKLEIVGFTKRRWKRPVDMKRVSDGKLFNASVAQVKLALK